jgi:endonuclease/exonuclease/phosphatase (EEP) superfamily protein YafD
VLRRRFAVASLIALWFVLLAAMLGRYAWPLDLFANFRVQYALLFLIVAIVLFALRAPVLGAVAIAGAVIGAIPIVSYMGVQTARADAGSAKFRVVTYNTWFRNHEYAEMARFLEQMQADVVVLQERDRDDGAQRIAGHLTSYPHSFIEPRPHGVVVFSRWPITSAELMPLTNGPGVLAAHVTLDWNGKAVTVLGAHLHWPLGPGASRMRNAELAGIASFAAARKEPVIVAGDFNATPWSHNFRTTLESSGLSDAAEGHGLAPSWPSQFPLVGMRIDHCWISRHWRSVGVRVGPSNGSDHLPLIADLVWTEAP